MSRHFVSLSEIPAEQLRLILKTAAHWKAQPAPKLAADKTLIMLFDKPSTRTRLSFEIAFNQLGGKAICLDSAGSQMSRGESIDDTFRVFSRYADAVIWRTEEHKDLERAERAARIPIINALTAYSHPCQIVGDLLTLSEANGELEEQTVVWFGDCNNVARSWLEAANVLDFRLVLVSPRRHSFAEDELGNAERVAEATDDLLAAANCVTTDTWFSMNNRRDNEKRRRLLRGYQVNEAVMAKAPKAVFLHCLPATRGEEVTAEVIDSERSLVWRQSENRIHAQKAILAWCLGEI